MPWEGMVWTITKGRHTDRDEDNDDNYSPHPSASAALAYSSDSKLAIPFRFGIKEAVATMVIYTKLAFLPGLSPLPPGIVILVLVNR